MQIYSVTGTPFSTRDVDETIRITALQNINVMITRGGTAHLVDDGGVPNVPLPPPSEAVRRKYMAAPTKAWKGP